MSRPVRTLDHLRRLATAGIVDHQLVDQAATNHRGLAICWCGYDLPEHDAESVDSLEGAPRQDHAFVAAGTRHVGWLLGTTATHGEPFEHDHHTGLGDTSLLVRSICLLCQVEAWERELGSPAVASS